MFNGSMGSEKGAKDQFSKKSKIYNESLHFLFFNTYSRVHLFDSVVLAFLFFFFFAFANFGTTDLFFFNISHS